MGERRWEGGEGQERGVFPRRPLERGRRIAPPRPSPLLLPLPSSCGSPPPTGGRGCRTAAAPPGAPAAGRSAWRRRAERTRGRPRRGGLVGRGGGEEKTRGGWGMRGRGEWVRTCALDETMHGQPCRRRAGSGRAGPGVAAARVTRGSPRTERAAARLAASHRKARGAAFCAQGGRWPCALGPGRAPASRRPFFHRAGQKGGRPGGGVPGRRARAGTAAAPPATRRGPTPHCPFAPRIPPPRRRPPSNDTHQGQPGASPARRTRSPGGRGTPWQWVGGWGVGEGAGREREKMGVLSLSLSLVRLHSEVRLALFSSPRSTQWRPPPPPPRPPRGPPPPPPPPCGCPPSSSWPPRTRTRAAPTARAASSAPSSASPRPTPAWWTCGTALWCRTRRPMTRCVGGVGDFGGGVWPLRR